VLRETVTYKGLTLNFVDTAGLRSTNNEIEAEGIRRAQREMESADYVVLVVDSVDNSKVDTTALLTEFFSEKERVTQKFVILLNKSDLSGITSDVLHGGVPVFAVSATKQMGFDAFFDYLRAESGLTDQTEGVFSARRRHIIALEKTLELVKTGTLQLRQAGAGELLAEDLRQAQVTLSEITGEFTSDDLLGRIFSSFCIGK